MNSTPGKGSSFYVYLPVFQMETSLLEGSRCEEVQEGIVPAHLHVLIVDDEVELVKLNKRRLERIGCVVTATADSQDALEKFWANPDLFDVLITDQTMPGLTGGELAKKILEIIKPSMPIITYT